MSILKALKRQAGKPFRVVEPSGLVPEWDHYSYKRDPDPIASSPDPHLEMVAAATEVEEVQVADAYQHVEVHDEPHIEEVVTTEILCEPPEVVSNGPDLATCMADGFQRVVEAVQSIKIEAPTYVPPTPVESLLKHSTKPETTRLKKHRVKVLNRDREGNIETIDLQEY